MLLSDPTMDIGLLPAPRDVGRCCHFTVPDRPGIAALGDGFGAVSGVSDFDVLEDGLSAFGVDGALGLLIEPKPLNSGTPSITELSVGVDGVAGRGEPTAATVLLGVCACRRDAAGVLCCCGCFSDEIDFARSVAIRHQPSPISRHRT